MVIFHEKDYLLSLFDGSALKDILHLLVQRPTLWRYLLSFCEVLIGSLTTENIEVFYQFIIIIEASRFPDKLLISIRKNNGPKNWSLRHTRFGCQILVHSEQFFVVIWIKKIRSKLEDQLSQPYILSNKLALHATLDQKI